VLRRLRNAILDASILYSFDRSGFARHARSFDPSELDVDLSGRVCLVTGASSGIGLATAAELAHCGARVHLLCRSRERGASAQGAIVAAAGDASVVVDVVDLSDLESIRTFVDRLAEEHVDVLVHNAGVLPAERNVTRDGLELTFATHVAGPFFLTHLLQPRLSAGARVVFVSSGGMYTQRLSLDDLDWTRREYDGVVAYAQTKRMQVILAELLAERDTGNVVFHSMHPGWADTEAVRTSLPRFWRLLRHRLRTPAEGADTVVWLAIATRPGGESGLFWFDRAPQTTHLLPFTRESAEERERLWDVCRRLATGFVMPTRESWVVGTNGVFLS
jgi:NAD(P)-dependent dehydrogenase (short-subunit alcohol dehydrogenase family)